MSVERHFPTNDAPDGATINRRSFAAKWTRRCAMVLLLGIVGIGACVVLVAREVREITDQDRDSPEFQLANAAGRGQLAR